MVDRTGGNNEGSVNCCVPGEEGVGVDGRRLVRYRGQIWFIFLTGWGIRYSIRVVSQEFVGVVGSVFARFSLDVVYDPWL